MHFVVDWPEGGSPHAWFAFDLADLLAKVAGGDPLAPHEIWDCASARELLDGVDATPDTPDVAARWPGICALGREHGWDTPLYRCDPLKGRGHFGPEPVTLLEACDAALRARGRARLWPDEASAVRAFEDATEPLWQGSGWQLRHALHEQLVATDVLADG